MPRKKKLLPRNFDELLKQGDLAALQAVFDTCEIDARGGYSKHTALAYDGCSDEFSRWLVAQGADLQAVDTYGDTPLHARTRSWRGGVEVLLELGADPHHVSGRGHTPLHTAAMYCRVRSAQALLAAGAHAEGGAAKSVTPLELALIQCNNANITQALPLAELLLSAGATRNERMAGHVEAIGKRFEFSRAAFNPDSVDATSAALDRLYTLFDATPAPRRAMHDGKAPIVAKAPTWQARHQELWELLVPPQGAAATAQGEAIRIAGRISRELDGNGGGNWNRDYALMADAFLAIVKLGQPLPDEQLEETAALVAQVRRKNGDTSRLAQLAVEWVRLNPAPIALATPAYKQ